MRPYRLHMILLIGALATLVSGKAKAQDRYHPLDHRVPTGTAGRWSLLTKPGVDACSQQVRISVPTQGSVTFYAGGPLNPVVQAAPAQAGMLVGRTYRVRISDMPEYPGVELFPTIEILDRLHPPQQVAQEFPIPVELTEEDIDIVLQDRMVTKVIYLENPNLAAPLEQTGGILTENVEPGVNLLQAADMRGRPMALLRIGGRIPDMNAPTPTDEYFTRAPIFLNAQ